jgi:hypothetical protein
MPWDIKPSVDYSTAVKPRLLPPPTDPNYAWATRQPHNDQALWEQLSNRRRGTITGGATYSQMLNFGHEDQWAVFKPRPVLTQPLTAPELQSYRRNLGAIEWDSINPFNTVDQVAEQVALATGQANAADGGPLGALKGASDFLASKAIEPFGMGSTGAPVRAADYAIAFPAAIIGKLLGGKNQTAVPPPLAQDDIFFKFRADPRYWHTIATLTDDQLHEMAKLTAGKYIDQAANGYLTEQMAKTFRDDREKQRNGVLGLATGNDSVDYQAIKLAPQMVQNFNDYGTWTHYGQQPGFGVASFPLIGTAIASLIDPVRPEDTAYWEALPIDQRKAILGNLGTQQMVSDMLVSLPAFSAGMSVIALARGGGLIARTAAGSYDWLLRGAGMVYTAGVASATANWALEAAVPGYSEYIGNEIDYARPLSGSDLAGTINALGYFASGTWGTSNIIRGGARAVRYAAEANTAVKAAAAAERGIKITPRLGQYESPLYVANGGARVGKLLGAEGVGLDDGLLRLGAQRLTMSFAIDTMRTGVLSTWKAIISGAKTGFKAIDDLPPEERVALAENDMAHSVQTSHAMGEMGVRVINASRAPARLFRSAEGLSVYRWVKDQARTLEDLIAKTYVTRYGPNWIKSVAGAYNEPAMRAYVEKAVGRLGGDFKALAGVKGEERWAQIMRTVHHYEFDARNGDLVAALKLPGASGEMSKEAGRVSIVSSRHIFNDAVKGILARLRDEDGAVARAEADRLIKHTEEGGQWFANDWREAKGEARLPENVKPEEIARWLEDVQPALLTRRTLPKPGSPSEFEPLNALHAQMTKDGVWDLAFKPVDAEGNAVSYVNTRDNYKFQTPWLDYPMGNLDNIEIGNRGMAMAKYDAIFRGFRTWRISEFQRALIYRSLSSRFDFQSAQIDGFYADVLTAARHYNVQPQTLGTVKPGTVGIGEAYKTALEEVAFKHFGAGPHLSRTGELIKIDWQKEVAEGYRQSLKLNFTAGLTSHMKSRFGAVGSAAALGSDIAYIQIRFNLSPLFKGGEVLESKMYNVMRGARINSDPQVEALMYTAGVGNDYGPMSQEMVYDQVLQGMSSKSGEAITGYEASASNRQAAIYGFYSRQAPQTFEQKAAQEALQVRVQEFQDRVAANFGDRPPNTPGPNAVYASPRHALEAELANSIDEFGNILPGMEDRVDELTRILSGELRLEEVNALHHVSQELPSADWSLDPAALGGSGKGAPDWVDSATRPEDRGMWHVTTATDAVHAQGLKARTELIAAQWAAEPELMRMIGGNAMRYRDMTIHYLDNGREVSFHPAGGDLTSMSYARLGHPWTGDLYDPFAGKPVAPYQITKVILDGKPIWQRKGTAPANMGLGASRPDRFVSVTTDYEHASTMERRHVLAVMAARNEATFQRIIDHFWEPYEMGRADVIGSMASATEDVARASNLRSQTSIKAMRAAQNEEALLAAIDGLLAGRSAATVAEFKYEFVKKLDGRLDRPVADTFGPSDSIGFVGDYQSMATVDPAQIGIVQVGARKGAEWHTGPDSFEIQMNSNDLWVLDQRILYHPLATDREGLLAQVRQTTREDGTVIPGMDAYHQRVVDEIAKLDAAAKPLGELAPMPFKANPGDKTGRSEMVPTKLLHQFREFDRRRYRKFRNDPGYYASFKAHVEERIAQGLPGIDPADPLIIDFDPATNMALLREGNHRLAIAEDLGITELPTRVVVQQKRATIDPEHASPITEKWRPLPDEPMVKPKLDGYISADLKPSQIFSHRVDQVSKVEDVFGTSEHLTKVIRDRGDETWFGPKASSPYEGNRAQRLLAEFKNPVPGKQQQTVRDEINKLSREFPILVDIALGPKSGLREVMTQMNVPEHQWLPFLLQDRVLAQRFSETGAQADFDALIALTGGKEAQGAFDALYASEDWQAVTGLFALASKTAADEAFRVHFFNPYRSAIERSINHPLMGVYPLSWAYKAAREWARFLFENHTLGINLGMAPAVALHNLVDAQNVAMAQATPADLETYLSTAGPFGSMLLIFNLLLPGDWSTIPFPASRSIRDLLRGNTSIDSLENQVMRLGLPRDVRLMSEMLGEVKDYVWGPDQPKYPNGVPPPWHPARTTTVLQPSTLPGDEGAYR